MNPMIRHHAQAFTCWTFAYPSIELKKKIYSQNTINLKTPKSRNKINWFLAPPPRKERQETQGPPNSLLRELRLSGPIPEPFKYRPLTSLKNYSPQNPHPSLLFFPHFSLLLRLGFCVKKLLWISLQTNVLRPGSLQSPSPPCPRAYPYCSLDGPHFKWRFRTNGVDEIHFRNRPNSPPISSTGFPNPKVGRNLTTLQQSVKEAFLFIKSYQFNISPVCLH